MRNRIVIVSRGSQLALTQSNWVADRLRALEPGLTVDIEIVSTKGDRILDAPLARIGGKGLFTKELEVAMLEKRADLAVHSLKDLPTTLPDGLALGAVPPREDPRDALVCFKWDSLEALPPDTTVGTSSLRRAAQLRAVRPDLNIIDLRGNVDTRVRKIREDSPNAGIMASAGLHRLGHADVIRQVIEPEVMVSAVGQGALGIEIREDDDELKALLQRLSDHNADLETRAERTLLAVLEGGCQVPVGALGRVNGDMMVLTAIVASLDGMKLLKTQIEAPAAKPEDLGQWAADELLRQGAAEIIAAIR
ncbi:MAG: hydroxymethylbilane synthase [FCB group bacterium]|jgi:hydroxymethylbilane synthase|nr:hydroxymethylbilane synthase [FCB group bacterium]